MNWFFYIGGAWFVILLWAGLMAKMMPDGKRESKGVLWLSFAAFIALWVWFCWRFVG